VEGGVAPGGGEASAEPPPSGWVELRVADTGPGIAPGDLELIFEEFEQVKGTTGGTGLGLPIARRLARLLGGELEVESELGVGSTFTLRLAADSPTPNLMLPIDTNEVSRA
jgi:signal transduction histidine kinase